MTKTKTQLNETALVISKTFRHLVVSSKSKRQTAVTAINRTFQFQGRFKVLSYFQP